MLNQEQSREGAKPKEGKRGEQEAPEKAARNTVQRKKEGAAVALLAEEELSPVSDGRSGDEDTKLDTFINVAGLEDTIHKLDEHIRGLEAEIAEIDRQLFDKAKFTAGWRRGEREALQAKQNQLKDALARVRKDRDETRDRLTKFREVPPQ